MIEKSETIFKQWAKNFMVLEKIIQQNIFKKEYFWCKTIKSLIN
jgi:hypothetical protein